MVSNFTRSGTQSDTAIMSVGSAIPMCLLAALVFWTAAPASLQAAADDEINTLRVQPRLCVMPADQQTCSMQLVVTWRVAKNRNVCLQLPGEAQFLQCWQAQQSGEFSMTLARAENVNLHLLDAQTLEVLGDVEIPVIKRDLRDTRRRRRHAWSIF